jgi:hypothetical protein
MARRKSKLDDAMESVLAKRPWDANDARVALEAFAESGLSQNAFSRQYGFSPERLSWWRRKFAVQSSRTKETQALVPVRIVESTPAAVEPAVARPRQKVDSGVEVVVGRGRRVRLCSGFDAETLYRAVEVLEVASC